MAEGRPAEHEPRVLVCLYDLALWYMQRTNRFPKNWRKTLGDRIDGVVLDMLATGQRARLRREKRDLLVKLNEDLDVLRQLTRLAVELQCIEGRQYEHVARQIDEIGRQTGGWIKYVSRQ